MVKGNGITVALLKAITSKLFPEDVLGTTSSVEIHETSQRLKNFLREHASRMATFQFLAKSVPSSLCQQRYEEMRQVLTRFILHQILKFSY